MPQMAPLSWLILFCLFTLSFLIFTIMNYFNKFFINKTQTMMKNENYITNKINWKW